MVSPQAQSNALLARCLKVERCPLSNAQAATRLSAAARPALNLASGTRPSARLDRSSRVAVQNVAALKRVPSRSAVSRRVRTFSLRKTNVTKVCFCTVPPREARHLAIQRNVLELYVTQPTAATPTFPKMTKRQPVMMLVSVTTPCQALAHKAPSHAQHALRQEARMTVMTVEPITEEREVSVLRMTAAGRRAGQAAGGMQATALGLFNAQLQSQQPAQKMTVIPAETACALRTTAVGPLVDLPACSVLLVRKRRTRKRSVKEGIVTRASVATLVAKHGALSGVTRAATARS